MLVWIKGDTLQKSVSRLVTLESEKFLKGFSVEGFQFSKIHYFKTNLKVKPLQVQYIGLNVEDKNVGSNSARLKKILENE